MAKRTRTRESLTSTGQQRRRLPTHQEQLKAITRWVQLELIRSGVIAGPPVENWTLEDAYPIPRGEQPPGTFPVRSPTLGTLLDSKKPPAPGSLTTHSSEPLPEDDGETASLEIFGRPAAVLAAALTVQDTFEKAHSVLPRLQKLLRRYADVAAELGAFRAEHRDDVLSRLSTLAASDWVATHGTNTPALSLDQQWRIIEALGGNAVARAKAARDFASTLDERAMPDSAVYSSTRHGPNVLFLALLDQLELSARDVTEVLGERPSRNGFSNNIFWENACKKAEHTVEVRVFRARSAVKQKLTRDHGDRVSLDQRILVLLCRYVQPGQRVSVDIRSGDDVQNADR